MSRLRILADPIDPAQVEASVRGAAHGATACFTGIVRELADDGRSVSGLSYEAHAEMAVAEFERIAAEAIQYFGTCEIAVAHRVGNLAVGDVAVAVAVGAVHRSTALDACRYAIDQLKARAPIWKREMYADGSSAWRDNCPPDRQA
ncbi:MAG TPA: molybdenum cofactor biosynthesis protein MoaE [Candidatus Baltobacteraceae bacterium]